MKRLSAGIACILIAASCFGQAADTLAWSPDATLNALWRPAPSPAEVSFRFAARFDVVLRTDRIGNTRHHHFAAYTQWLYNESFMEDSVAARCQPLAQLYFDCYELESRKLQVNLNLPDASMGLEILQATQRAQTEVNSLRLFTNEGRYTKQFLYWRQWMDSALVATPRIYPPDWKEGPIEFGMDVGAGAIAYTGALSQTFSANAGLAYGLSFRVKRFAFDYRTIHCYDHSLQPFGVADFKFSDTNRIQINQASWSFGWQVIRKSHWTHWSVIPYIGMSTFRVINRDEPKGSLYHKGRVSLNAEAGVMTEWRFNLFYQGNTAQFNWKLLFKAGYAPVNYLHTVSGGALKIQVGIGYTLKSVINTRFES